MKNGFEQDMCEFGGHQRRSERQLSFLMGAPVHEMRSTNHDQKTKVISTPLGRSALIQDIYRIGGSMSYTELFASPSWLGCWISEYCSNFDFPALRVAM
jgi:hypothetical protein